MGAMAVVSLIPLGFLLFVFALTVVLSADSTKEALLGLLFLLITIGFPIVTLVMVLVKAHH